MSRVQRVRRYRKQFPVRFVAGVSGTVQLLTQAVVIFNVWHPTVEQLAFTNGAVVAFAAAWGVTAAKAHDDQNS